MWATRSVEKIYIIGCVSEDCPFYVSKIGTLHLNTLYSVYFIQLHVTVFVFHHKVNFTLGENKIFLKCMWPAPSQEQYLVCSLNEIDFRPEKLI